MQEFLTVTGMIIKQMPVGEYDRRICILTKERGKISAFAKGARKPGNRLAAATNPFSFGVFKIFQGRTSYNIMDADIQNYFEELRNDFVRAYYGMYFAEFADFYTRENNDERQMLKLLYQSLRALSHPSLDLQLVKSVFELKSIMVNGEYPGIPKEQILDEATVYTLTFIENSPIEKLYTFTVKENVLRQLMDIADNYRNKITNHTFKSLDILKNLC